MPDHISGMDGQMKQKEYKSMRCGFHYMTFTFDLTHDLAVELSRSNFKIIFQE